MIASYLPSGLDRAFAYATSGCTTRVGGPSAGIPLGFGFDVTLTGCLGVDLEATYPFQVGESSSDDTTTTKGGAGIDGGDLTTFSAGVRVRL